MYLYNMHFLCSCTIVPSFLIHRNPHTRSISGQLFNQKRVFSIAIVLHVLVHIFYEPVEHVATEDLYILNIVVLIPHSCMPKVCT